MSSLPSGHGCFPRVGGRSLWRVAFVQIAFGALSALTLTSCQLPGFGSPTSTVSRPTPTETPSFGAESRSRPLHLPTLAAGASCSKTSAQNPNDGVGDGPVYLRGGGGPVEKTGVIKYAPPANFASDEWGGQAVIWAVRPDYQWIVLVRGRQFDGPNEVRFGRGNVPNNELVFRAEPSDQGNGWSTDDEYIRVRALGCYGVQIDTSVASEVVVFQALTNHLLCRSACLIVGGNKSVVNGRQQHPSSRSEIPPFS